MSQTLSPVAPARSDGQPVRGRPLGFPCLAMAACCQRLFAVCRAALVVVACGAARGAEPGLADLHFNQVQVVGTHNSYHLRPDAKLLKTMIAVRRDAREWDYSRETLDRQLDHGVRSFELDLHLAGTEWQVMHVPTFDAGTTVRTFADALGVIGDWSRAHPRHVPISVLLELKEEGFALDRRYRRPAAADLDLLDEVIRAAFGPERLFTPDDLRQGADSLPLALANRGWPTLGAMAGRVLFMLHEQGPNRAHYLEGHAALEGRAMFVNATPGEAHAAAIVLDNPADPQIAELARAGYWIRTRVDSQGQRPAERRHQGLAGGAHILSTDYPMGEVAEGDAFGFEGQAPARVNPLTGPAELAGQAVAEPLADSSAGDPTTAAARRPNVVIIVADDLGYADVGFHGCRDIPTPQIDRLAARGVVCRQGYVSGPYCSPTRAGLLTGRYQQRFGHEFNPGKSRRLGNRTEQIGLPTSEVTLADRFRAAGYATALIGKWHLGEAQRFWPTRRGFETYFGFLGGAHTYFPARTNTILRGDNPVLEQAYLTDALAREAISFVRANHDKPFLLYLAFNAVHTPLEADRGRLAKFAHLSDPKRRSYAAMLSAMDDAVGGVLDTLGHLGLERDTLVWFISDNGGPVMQGTTVNGSSNAPLRGSKRTTLEGGVRVPFVVSWPARLPGGTTYDRPVIQLDVAPTALAAAGIAVEDQEQFDGLDLAPYLSGANSEPPHRTLYWRLGAQMAVRHGDWKLVRYDPTVDGVAGPPVTSHLYNLADDLGEAHDRAAHEPARVTELESLWNAWSQQMAEPLWSP